MSKKFQDATVKKIGFIPVPPPSIAASHREVVVFMRWQILIVSADAVTSALISSHFARAGYEVLPVQTAAEARERVRSQSVHLAIAEATLPDMTGLELCGRLRRESALPFLLLADPVAEVDSATAFEAGVDDYLTEPISVRELEVRVKAILRRTEAHPPADGAETIRCGPVTIDRVGHGITCRGRSVQLTQTEYRILTVLAQSPGRVFTRDDLMVMVNRTRPPIKATGLNRHIQNLRAKLEEDRSHPRLIETVAGFGYRFRIAGSP